MNSSNGDVITEQTFVDVLAINVVHDRALVLLNNQVGDFRTRISVYDLQADNIFGDRESKENFTVSHNSTNLVVQSNLNFIELSVSCKSQ